MNVNNYKIDKELIVNELKSLGIKCTKKKEKNKVPDKLTRKRIFKTHLHLLELTDVILSNGEIVQIPSFVSDCCQRILEEIDTEGLFRKAGSTSRQKQIRANVEAGLQLGKNYHVIDVANVLKSFLRDLPEPLLAPYIQEFLLRSYLIGEDKLNAILLSCLLLPPLTVNTLAYFMQFLFMISSHIDKNRMSIQNLAIIFAPSLMPANDLTSIRFNNHIKIIELLIQHSSSIGVLPEHLISKLQHQSSSSSAHFADLSSADVDKRKKKRRSGSLTRMFNGIKKIVGAIGSSENLENTSDTINSISTPYISKSTKKRKIAENDQSFNNKIKNDIRGLLPNGNLLPNTPVRTNTKAEKKSRISLGGWRTVTKVPANEGYNVNVERRWSVVGSAWTKKKLQSSVNQETKSNHLLKPLSPVVSLPNLPKMDLDYTPNALNAVSSTSISPPNSDNTKSLEIDYFKITEKEYEEIKDRVASIERRISQEFVEFNSLFLNEKDNVSQSDEVKEVFISGPEKVINKFELINDETTSHQMSQSTTFANKLTRELKIRRSDNVIRSPSARKIGSIRRRSRENIKPRGNIRLTRTASCHVPTGSKSPLTNNIDSHISSVLFYPKGNLKRGRPNTIQTGLCNKSSENEYENINTILKNEEWTSGEVFFKNNIEIEKSFPKSALSNVKRNSGLSTPEKYVTVINIEDEIKTPMLPPKLIPQKHYFKTPRTNEKSITKQKSVLTKFKQSSNDVDELNGRASIARLRALNAGQVLAKAKLFDNLNDNDVPNISKINSSAKISSAELKRRSALFVPSLNIKPVIQNNGKTTKVQRNEKRTITPHKILNSKSPCKIQKQRRIIGTKYPNNKLLPQIELDEQTLTPKNLNTTKFKQLRNINFNLSPRKSHQLTPKLKKNFKIKAHKLDKDYLNCRTPVKAVPIVRSSPRFTLNT